MFCSAQESSTRCCGDVQGCFSDVCGNRLGFSDTLGIPPCFSHSKQWIYSCCHPKRSLTHFGGRIKLTMQRIFHDGMMRHSSINEFNLILFWLNDSKSLVTEIKCIMCHSPHPYPFPYQIHGNFCINSFLVRSACYSSSHVSEGDQNETLWTVLQAEGLFWAKGNEEKPTQELSALPSSAWNQGKISLL